MSPNSNLGLIQNPLLAFSWKWLVSAFFIFIFMHHQGACLLLVFFEIYMSEHLLVPAFGVFTCISIQKVYMKRYFMIPIFYLLYYFSLFSCSWFLNKFAKVKLFLISLYKIIWKFSMTNLLKITNRNSR